MKVQNTIYNLYKLTETTVSAQRIHRHCTAEVYKRKRASKHRSMLKACSKRVNVYAWAWFSGVNPMSHAPSMVHLGSIERMFDLGDQSSCRPLEVQQWIGLAFFWCYLRRCFIRHVLTTSICEDLLTIARSRHRDSSEIVQ